MIKPLNPSGPYQLAHKLIRSDPELIEGLNAISTRLGRTVPDIVLFICLETFFPERGLSWKTWPSARDDESNLVWQVHEKLTEKKKFDGTPITRAIAHAVRMWLATNLVAIGKYGDAVLRRTLTFDRPAEFSDEELIGYVASCAITQLVQEGGITRERGAFLRMALMDFWETLPSADAPESAFPV